MSWAGAYLLAAAILVVVPLVRTEGEGGH
jgi:hypothetical protein